MKNKQIVIIALFFTLVFGSFSSFLSNDKVAAATPSFLMDTKKIYTYAYYYKNTSKSKEYMTASFTGKMKKGDLWNYQWGDFFNNELTIQNSEGLIKGDPFEDSMSLQIAFPLTVGMEWESDGHIFKTISLNQTVKTPAGTFRSVMIDNGRDDTGTSYYAPGVGLVKYEDENGYVTELVSIKNSHYGRVLIKQNGVKLYNPKGGVHRTLKKGEGLKVFKESSSSFDVGGGYYVKKAKNTLFYTGFIFGTEEPLYIYAPDGQVYRKVPAYEAIRAYGFENGKFLVGGGYYVFADYHVLYER
ncbi:hypothetical protein [Metabacillus fastidiosus]|uniref:hypothetical protein n=1 Tax=Metabacillus fastidiosus TaxID=1458 RepID=UPI002DBA301E|nr:hypothetical protein [Metabacillus fastidiosus]MEC2075749.1 hypothetical protein [Metabacillus fastidiosus]